MKKLKRISDWEELVIGIPIITESEKIKIVEYFWNNIGKYIDINIINTYFHLRRVFHKNIESGTKRNAHGRIEVFRLKKGCLSDIKKEQIRTLFESNDSVLCAGWWPVYFNERHDELFLAFLQILSIIRINKVFYQKEDLAEITDLYEKCPICKKAYKIMTSKNNEWNKLLGPYIDKIKSLPPNIKYEYAHWFGHIMTRIENV